MYDMPNMVGVVFISDNNNITKLIIKRKIDSNTNVFETNKNYFDDNICILRK